MRQLLLPIQRGCRIPLEAPFHRASVHLLLVVEQPVCSAGYCYRRIKTQGFSGSQDQLALKQQFVFLGPLLAIAGYGLHVAG